MSESKEVFIHADGSTAYLAGIQAAVISDQTRRLLAEPERKPLSIAVKGMEDPPPMVPWGISNDLPAQLTENCYKLPQMSSDLQFNILATYGDGIKPVKVSIGPTGEKVLAPYKGNAEVADFFAENDLDMFLLEQCTDLHYFYNVFPEIIFNREDGNRRKIVEIHSKEAVFSRWSEMDASGYIPYHYYFAHWGQKNPDEQQYVCTATPVLDARRPIQHLREMMEQDRQKSWNKRRNRFIVPVSFPTPGRNYYSKPYWFSIIESGWFDFATQIPSYKKAIMQNQLGIRYVILLDGDYFPEIFRREKITDEKAQRKRIKKEYEDIEKFVKGAEKAGSTLITFTKKDPTGKPYPMITIEPVSNEFKGGEYIEDSEEVSNIIHYAMMVQPSLVGPQAGKNKSISGTEARELFIIKQALLKPFRDRILRPFYLIKAINRWPDDLHFVIPNIELTTLDKQKTGSITQYPDV